MAGGKETPRQKMIGMMYLVLLALLAMNVSKDILNAFITVDSGLQNTLVSITDKNQQTYDEFKFQMAVDSAKTHQYYSKAMEVQQFSDSITSYIKQLKTHLIAETDGIPITVADTIALANVSSKDNYDVPTYIMVGTHEDGSKGRARALKLKLEAYKNQLNSVLDTSIAKKLNLDFNTQDPPTTSEGRQTWEVANFYHSPIVATITMLSKIEADVKNAEYAVLKELYRGIRKTDLTFDTVAAKVIAPSNYVLLGSDYKAEIMLAAYSTTQKPDIQLGEYDDNYAYTGSTETVDIIKGVGEYITRPIKEGIHKIKGILKIRDQEGNIKPFPFESSYIAAKPALVVSADKMNVMYQGVPNPISVSVPGVPFDKLKVSRSSNVRLTPKGGGKYDAVVSGGNTAQIIVSADFGDGNFKPMGTMDFRVKRVPNPEPEINGKQGGKISKRDLQNKPILTLMKNFDFPAKWVVESYDFVYPGRPAIRNNGYMPNQTIRQMMQQLRSDEIIVIRNIKIKGVGDLAGKRRTMQKSLSFEIN
jgi:gliding motility-associated protein GldM